VLDCRCRRPDGGGSEPATEFYSTIDNKEAGQIQDAIVGCEPNSPVQESEGTEECLPESAIKEAPAVKIESAEIVDEVKVDSAGEYTGDSEGGVTHGFEYQLCDPCQSQWDQFCHECRAIPDFSALILIRAELANLKTTHSRNEEDLFQSHMKTQKQAAEILVLGKRIDGLLQELESLKKNSP
jgi:hypothetical protein